MTLVKEALKESECLVRAMAVVPPVISRSRCLSKLGFLLRLHDEEASLAQSKCIAVKESRLTKLSCKKILFYRE